VVHRERAPLGVGVVSVGGTRLTKPQISPGMPLVCQGQAQAQAPRQDPGLRVLQPGGISGHLRGSGGTPAVCHSRRWQALPVRP